MSTDFGQTSYAGGMEDVSAGIWVWNRNYTTGYTCPGSGNQTVDYIQGYVQYTSGTAGHIRLAVYTTAGSLVCQGHGEVTVSNGTAAWVGHTAFSGTPTLTGGTGYKITLSADSSTMRAGYITGSANDTEYDLTDYTGGFPASLSPGSYSGYNHVFAIKCGVTAEGGEPGRTAMVTRAKPLGIEHGMNFGVQR